MKKYWNATKKELITAFAAIGTAYAAGFLLNVLITFILGDGNTYYSDPIGSICSLITGLVIWVFAGSSAMRKRFTLTVSMSNTRSSYIRQELFCAVGGSLFLMSVWCLFFCAEYLFISYSHWEYMYTTLLSVNSSLLNGFPDFYDHILNYSYLQNFTNIAGLGTFLLYFLSVYSLIIGCRMLLDSLLLRFGNIVFWILLLSCLVILSIEGAIDTIIIFISLEFSWLVILLLGILLSLIGIRIMKRQEVLPNQ